MNKKLLFFIILIIFILFIIKELFYSTLFYLPVKYWFKEPKNFAECVEATGIIFESLPAQCDFKHKIFIDCSRGNIGLLSNPLKQELIKKGEWSC